MDAVVIDTNVILVAKGMSEQAWDECVTACQERLDRIINGTEKVIIDNKWIILEEYLDYLDDEDSTTNARNGRYFLEWFIRNYENPEQCIHVNITHSDDGMGFEELPIAFIEFDADDNKFIAVAVAYENQYQNKATILQSVDSQWYGLKELFTEYGLVVEFLCEENIRDLYERRERRRNTQVE